MYHWTFIAAGSNMNFEANTSGGWQVYGDSLQNCHAPAEPRLAQKLLEVREGFVNIMPPGSNAASYDPAGRGLERIAKSNLDTNSAMVSYYDRDPEMFALSVVLCQASAPVWLDMLKFVRANGLRFTVDIGFVGFPPFTSHYEAVSYDEFIAAEFMERRAVFSAEATLRVLPVKTA